MPQFIKWSATLIPLTLLYASMMIEMGKIWRDDPNYSHGFLIPLISLFFVWQQKGKIDNTEKTPDRFGYIPLVFGVLLYIVGTAGDELFSRGVSLIFVISGMILVLQGRKVFRLVSFSLLYLILMIPLPYFVYNEIAVPLKMLAAKISTDMLQLFSYPILREGNILHLPNLTLEVADACSGIRSLISIIALSLAIAWMFHRAKWKRLSLLLISIPIAVSVNIVRVVGTGILSFHFGEKMAKGFFHEFQGLVIFGAALFMLFGSSFLLGRFGKEKLH